LCVTLASGGPGIGSTHLVKSEDGGRYLAREPVTAPHEAAMDGGGEPTNERGCECGGGAVLSAPRLAASQNAE
jgi:hypothetical protein